MMTTKENLYSIIANTNDGFLYTTNVMTSSVDDDMRFEEFKVSLRGTDILRPIVWSYEVTLIVSKTETLLWKIIHTFYR